MYYYQLFQVTQCQLLLDVQLVGFQNENLETRTNAEEEIVYCCCDALYMFECSKTIPSNELDSNCPVYNPYRMARNYSY